MSGSDADVRLLAQADLLFLIAGWLGNQDHAAAAELDAEKSDLQELAACSGLGDRPRGVDLLLRVNGGIRSTDRAARSVEHNRLFDAAIACQPNETAYIRRDKGAILADICGFYEAFGFEPAEGSGEKPDHLAAELQFVALLLVMLARARQSTEADRVQITHDALRSFAGDHLGAWLELFCDRLARVTNMPFYVQLAELLRLAWGTVVNDNGLPDPEKASSFPLVRDDGTPYECGVCKAGAD